MDDTYATINESLRKKVGLEKFYTYEIERDLKDEDGKRIRGVVGMMCADRGVDILLADNLHGYETGVYLHEVGHVIASITGIDDAPGSNGHNKYFAVLVAVMYRRANLLDRLKVYDFGDTDKRFNGKGGAAPADDELISRFQYIISRSANFARSNLTIEKIANELYYQDYLPALKNARHRENKRERIDWKTLIQGVIIGGGLMASAAIFAIVSMWIKFVGQ